MQSNRDKLTEYISANRHRLYRIARMYVSTEDEAFDIVSESVLKALTEANKATDIVYMKSWFYRTVVNCAIDYLRKNKKYLLAENPETYGPLPVQDHEDDITSRLILKEILDGLAPKYKTVIILRYYENLRYNEIATILKCPQSTVKSRVRKALELIEKEINCNE